jgi:hypothetical protein
MVYFITNRFRVQSSEFRVQGSEFRVERLVNADAGIAAISFA